MNDEEFKTWLESSDLEADEKLLQKVAARIEKEDLDKKEAQRKMSSTEVETKDQEFLGQIEACVNEAKPSSAEAASHNRPFPKDKIRSVFMAHGFTVKEGQSDLKSYVYDAAHALLALGDEISHEQHQQLECELKSAKDALAIAKADSERLQWLRDSFFTHKWNGVVGQGFEINWQVASGYRHKQADLVDKSGVMSGDFRSAVDAARLSNGTPSK